MRTPCPLPPGQSSRAGDVAWGRTVQASSSGLSRLFPRDVTWVPSPSPPRRKTGRPGPDPEAPVQSADGVRGGSSLSVSDGRRGSGTCWSVALQLARQGRSSSCVTDAHPRPGQGDRLPASPAPGVLVWVDAGLSDPGDGLATGLFPLGLSVPAAGRAVDKPTRDQSHRPTAGPPPEPHGALRSPRRRVGPQCGSAVPLPCCGRGDRSSARSQAQPGQGEAGRG